jgi:hypothetical protein
MLIQVFLTSAMVGRKWSASCLGRFTPEDRRLGGPQNRSGLRAKEKSLAPTGIRTPTPLPSIPYLMTTPTALSRVYT